MDFFFSHLVSLRMSASSEEGNIAEIVERLRKKGLLTETPNSVTIKYGVLMADENQDLADALADAGWVDKYEAEEDLDAVKDKVVKIKKEVWDEALEGGDEDDEDEMILEEDEDEDEDENKPQGVVKSPSAKKASGQKKASEHKAKSDEKWSETLLNDLFKYHEMEPADWNDFDSADKQTLIDAFMEARAPHKQSPKKQSPEKKKPETPKKRESAVIPQDLAALTPRQITRIIIDNKDNVESFGNNPKAFAIYLTVAKAALKGKITAADYYQTIVCHINPEEQVEMNEANKKIAAYKELGLEVDPKWQTRAAAVKAKLDACLPFGKLPIARRRELDIEAKNYAKANFFPAKVGGANKFLSAYTEDELVALLKGLRRSELYGDYKRFPISDALRAFEKEIQEREQEKKDACIALASNTMQNAFVAGDLGKPSVSNEILAKLLEASLGFINKIAGNKYVLENLVKCEDFSPEDTQALVEEEQPLLTADDETGAKIIGFFAALFDGQNASPKYDIGKFKADDWNKITQAAGMANGVQAAKAATLAKLSELGIQESALQDKVKEVEERAAAAEQKAKGQEEAKQKRALRKQVQEALARGDKNTDILALGDAAIIAELIEEERNRLAEREGKAAAKKEEKARFQGWPRDCKTETDDNGNCPDGYGFHYQYSNKDEDECCFTISENEFRQLVARQQELKKRPKDDAAAQTELKEVAKAIKYARILGKRLPEKPMEPAPKRKENIERKAAVKKAAPAKRLPKEEQERLIAAMWAKCDEAGVKYKDKDGNLQKQYTKKGWDSEPIRKLRTKCLGEKFEAKIAADLVEELEEDAQNKKISATESAADAVISRSSSDVARANELAKEAEKAEKAAENARKELERGKAEKAAQIALEQAHAEAQKKLAEANKSPTPANVAKAVEQVNEVARKISPILDAGKEEEACRDNTEQRLCKKENDCLWAKHAKIPFCYDAGETCHDYKNQDQCDGDDDCDWHFATKKCENAAVESLNQIASEAEKEKRKSDEKIAEAKVNPNPASIAQAAQAQQKAARAANKALQAAARFEADFGVKGKQASKVRRLAALDLQNAVAAPLPVGSASAQKLQNNQNYAQMMRKRPKIPLKKRSAERRQREARKLSAEQKYVSCYKMFRTWLSGKKLAKVTMQQVDTFLEPVLRKLREYYGYTHSTAEECFDDWKFRKQIEVLAMIQHIVPRVL